jgi:hypothetical protein
VIKFNPVSCHGLTSLGHFYASRRDKKLKSLDGVFIYQLAGKKPLHEIIRHKLPQDFGPIFAIGHDNVTASSFHRRLGTAVKPIIVPTVVDKIAVRVVKDLPSQRP